MRIEDVAVGRSNGRCRLGASIVWEDSEKSPLRVYYEVEEEHANALDENEEAMVIAACLAAQQAGEKRVSVEGPLCPVLEEGLERAQRLLRSWYKDKNPVCTVESKRGLKPKNRRSERAAMFLSGGVDSLYSLLVNKEQFPKGHPFAVATAITVYGLDVGDPNKPARPDVFDLSVGMLRTFAEREGVTLIPLWTNVRDILPDGDFYDRDQYGSLLAAIGHALAGTCGRVFLAANSMTEYLGQHADTPELVHCFSSTLLDVELVGARHSRLEKVRKLAEREDVLNVLRVCYTMDSIPLGAINCGECPKCTRTKLELAALGVLEKVDTFPRKEISLHDVARISIELADQLEYFEELVHPLRTRGLVDLAQAVERRIAAGYWYLGRQRRRELFHALLSELRLASINKLNRHLVKGAGATSRR